MENLYKAAVVAVCLLGALFIALAVSRGLHPLDQMDAATLLIIVGGLGFSAFSFLSGGQPGHWVRAVTAVLVCAMAGAQYLRLATDCSPKVTTLIMLASAVGLGALWAKYGARFRDEYRARGQVNYFKKYFR